MPLIAWSEKYATGVARIDAQHWLLFDKVNLFHDAMKQRQGREKICEVLDFLAAYVHEHFSAEESLLQTHRYPGYLGHRHAHEALTKKVNQLIVGYKSGDAALTLEASQMLVDWIGQHIETHDLQYAPFLKEKGVN